MTSGSGVVVLQFSADDVLALKPAGLPCEMPRDAAADSLLRRLEAAGHSGLRLVHRLDAVACGLVLLARSRESAAYYSAEIEARRWLKLYVARVAVPGEAAAGLVGPHKAYLRTAGPRAEIVRSGGKPSFLDVVATAPAPDGPAHSHAVVRLHTGRFHQIRAMLAGVGAPLVGDPLYGGADGRFYLEHVLLGACRRDEHEWRVWEAPAHADRDRWSAATAAAVAGHAATARMTPPPRVPGR